MSFIKGLRCIDCDTEYRLEDSITVCSKCSSKGLGFGILDPVYDYEEIGKILSTDVLESRIPSLWKYRELMPISDKASLVTLGEGGTPLVRGTNLSRKLGMEELYIKNETLNPTFSFKDRVFSVIITRALENGADAVAAVSDGNAGCSAAAYSATAGIKCRIFTPSFAVVSKLIQMSMYDAEIYSVRGTLIDTGMLVIEACEKYGWYNITTAKLLNPFQTEGHKTLAYEISEQLNWEPPDWAITPVASGDSLGAIWKGFKEFHTMGFIKKLPRMVGVQGEGAAPLAIAFEEGKEFFEVELPGPKTIADALCIGMVPGSWPSASLRESNGYAVAVSDTEILDAQRLLASSEGIFVEPSSASTLAGLMKLLGQGVIASDETVVCIVTGSGLKVLDIAERHYRKPVSIGANLEDLEKVLQ